MPSLPPLGSKKQTAPRPPLPPPGGHFLRNVNLNGNLLDIPDPPSPPKRNARRQSSPLLRPLPLHDRTNEEENSTWASNEPSLPTTTTFAGAAAAAVTTNKRSRKSLCHVPSPLTESNHRGMNPVESLPQETASSSSSLICFDDDHDIPSSSKRQKRRESMILPSNMASMKQEEFRIINDATSESSTNGGEKSCTVENQKDDSIMATNKRRLSIVLPSDIVSFQQQVTTKLLECTVETSNHNKTVSFHQDDDKMPQMATRTSKRQSMMLPTDALILQDQDATEYFGQLHTVQTKESNLKSLVSEKRAATEDTVEFDATITTKDETTAKSNTETAPKESSFNHLTSLVREYCSLPQSERHESMQAQEIERLTGYALIPPAAKKRALQTNLMNHETDNFISSQNNVVAAKRELLLKLGEMVDVMDKRKTQDTTLLEEITKCRVERSRNGKYRYFHIVTNRKVRPSEYEQLYLSAIQQTRADMSMRIQEWLRQDKHQMSEQEEEERCKKLSALIQNAQQQQSNEFLVQQEQERSVQVSLDDRAASESDMEESPASESSESMDSDTKMDSSVHVTVEQATDDMEDTSCMEEGDTSILSLEEDVPIQDDPKAVSDSILNDTGESSELLLPFPSRQDSSDDPEIAAAEKRLWCEIDQALERYSRQVIAIRQARACERKDVL